MESPRKFNDCYFYYYSTCTKGDNCVFRHEPSALGCETMCSAWQQGKCLDKHCKLRHMELRKNRKQIPCYWESQPGGCRKKHCPFMHKNPDARTDGIAPSQPTPPVTAQATTATSVPSEACTAEQPAAVVPPILPTAMPAPHQTAVPLLWQQQRQVVLDSTILGVLPASAELGRRVMPQAHEAPNPYGQMPVDPLVVNFEEESDNESAPSSTPTKDVTSEEAHKSQELLLLEKIQAEAAAYYGYDNLPPVDTANDRKIVRANLSTKYDRLSLDEISGKMVAMTERRKSSVDFKVLSLEEIRAKKKASETVVDTQPITLNLNRKRKISSTQEINTTSGNKILKLVRSNSIVYKKLDSASSVSSQTKVSVEIKQDHRKRTISEISDDVQENELVDNCFEFKRIHFTKTSSKPRLIRNRCNSNSDRKVEDVIEDGSKTTNNDSDNEVQIVDVSHNTSLSKSDYEIIEDSVDIVELSDEGESDKNASDLELVTTNVPDIVASCQKNTLGDRNDTDMIHDIDMLLESSDDEDL